MLLQAIIGDEIVSLVIIILTIIGIKRRPIYYGNELIIVLIGALISLGSHLIFLLTSNPKIGLLTGALFLSCGDWLSLGMLRFIIEYSEDSSVRYDKIKKIFYITSIIDTFVLLVNMFYPVYFSLDRVDIDFGLSLFKFNYTSFYLIHIIYIIIVVGQILFTILFQAHKSKGIYKRRYIGILFSVFVIGSGICITKISRCIIDYYVLVYGLVALILTFIVVRYIPRVITKTLKNNIIDYMDDALIAFDVDGRLVYQNRKAKYYNEILYKNKNYETLFKDITKKKKLSGLMSSTWESEYTYKKDKLYFKFTYKKLVNEKNDIIGSYILMYDITETVNKTKEEHYKVAHDQLTGIYNREYFELKVKEIFNNYDKKFYMIFTDIKSFKLLNEIYGSGTADKALINLANELDRLYSKIPTVSYCRIANDNFAILIDSTTYNKSNLKAKLDAVNNSFDFNINLYFGIYKITDKNKPISYMLDCANLAVKQIKTQYKETINFYDEEIKTNIINEQYLAGSIKDGIENKEFEMFLQPQVASGSGNVTGAEALIRWKKDGEYISPNSFIPIAEKIGMISELDRIIWEKAIIKLKEWESKGLDYYISVNISPEDFYLMDVYEYINELVNKYDIDNSKLRLEITESVFISNVADVVSIINKFRTSGFVIEMDDFGSGYSSLNLLKDLNIDVVKLDMAFLYEPKDIKKCKIIISTLIDMFKQLGLDIVAEGVETNSQKEFLKKLECDLLQGYYYSRPIPVSEFEEVFLTNDKKGE